jgi:hypothetical protein
MEKNVDAKFPIRTLVPTFSEILHLISAPKSATSLQAASRWAEEQLRQTQQTHPAKKQHDHAFAVLQVGPAHAAASRRPRQTTAAVNC